MNTLDSKKDRKPPYYEFSAILDEQTCRVCRFADGMKNVDPNKIPHAPNPRCESSFCRCFVVFVGV